MEEIFGSLSPEFKRFAPQFVSLGGVILDAPCGLGRHSIYLAQLGAHTLAVDIDEKRLAQMNLRINQFNKLTCSITAIQFDLLSDLKTLPGTPFAGLVNVHFLHETFLARISELVRKGGLLYLETPDSRGENYLELPKKSELCKVLDRDFEFIFYRERPAGPKGSRRVSVRFLARRK